MGWEARNLRFHPKRKGGHRAALSYSLKKVMSLAAVEFPIRQWSEGKIVATGTNHPHEGNIESSKYSGPIDHCRGAASIDRDIGFLRGRKGQKFSIEATSKLTTRKRSHRFRLGGASYHNWWYRVPPDGYNSNTNTWNMIYNWGKSPPSTPALKSPWSPGYHYSSGYDNF